MNITYIYTPILCCSTSIWHLPSRGTVYMQTKWLFRWKISAIAFYLGRLGFKPLIRSQVKISLVLLSYLTFVRFTQLLLIQAVPGVTSSPCSKGGEGLQRRRILSVSDSGAFTGAWRKKNAKGKKKKQGRTQGSHWVLFVCLLFVFSIKNHFHSIFPAFFFNVPTCVLRFNCISQICQILKGLLMWIGYLKTTYNICSL